MTTVGLEADPAKYWGHQIRAINNPGYDVVLRTWRAVA